MNKNIVIGFLFLMSLQLHGASAEGETDETPCMRDLKAFEDSTKYQEWLTDKKFVNIAFTRANIIVESLQKMQATGKKYTTDQLTHALMIAINLENPEWCSYINFTFNKIAYKENLKKLVQSDFQPFDALEQVHYQEQLIDYSNALNASDDPLGNESGIAKNIIECTKRKPREDGFALDCIPHITSIQEYNQRRKNTLATMRLKLSAATVCAPFIAGAGYSALKCGATSLGIASGVTLAAALFAGSIYKSAEFFRLCINEKNPKAKRTVQKSFLRASGIGALAGASWFSGSICCGSGNSLLEGLLFTGCGALAGAALNGLGYYLNKKYNDGLFLTKTTWTNFSEIFQNTPYQAAAETSTLLPAPRFVTPSDPDNSKIIDLNRLFKELKSST